MVKGQKKKKNRKTYFEHDLRKVEVKRGTGRGEQNKDCIPLKERERMQGGQNLDVMPHEIVT